MRKKKHLKMFAVMFALIMALCMSTVIANAATKKVTISAKSQTVYVGTKNKSLGVKVTSGAKATYKSSTPSIVSVTSTGKITAKKAGSAKITIKASKKGYVTTTKVITVKAVKRNQTITASDVSVSVGSTKQIGAKAKTTLLYKSTDTGIVIVDSKGIVTGKKAGTAYISIYAKNSTTYNCARKKIKVSVIEAQSSNSVLPVVKKPSIGAHASVYAEIPELGVSYGVRENTVKYGASCMKFVYTYYAYCVKNWGSKKLTYKQNGSYVTNTLKECAKQTLEKSDNDAALAIFEYIRKDSTRRKEFMNWMKKILNTEVPVLSEGYKYRIGYNSYCAYCPYTTAKEITTFWKYIGKEGSEKISIQRYKDFFIWTKTNWLWSDFFVLEEYGKIGYLQKGGELSVETNGALYIVRLNDGNLYMMYISYMEDYFNRTSIFAKVGEVAEYMRYLGNLELEKQGKLLTA